MNLRQKLFAIQKECDAFIKDAQSHNHDFVSGTSILKKIRAQMDVLGLMLETHVTGDPIHNFETHVLKDKYDKPKPVTFTRISIPVDMVWYDIESDESHRVPWRIEGEHDNDLAQAFGSGLTYSERYFLSKYFKVPTDKDDPDSKQRTEQRMENRQSSSGPVDYYITYKMKSGKFAGKSFSEIDDKGWLEFVANGNNENMKKHAIRRLAELKG